MRCAVTSSLCSCVVQRARPSPALGSSSACSTSRLSTTSQPLPRSAAPTMTPSPPSASRPPTISRRRQASVHPALRPAKQARRNRLNLAARQPHLRSRRPPSLHSRRLPPQRTPPRHLHRASPPRPLLSLRARRRARLPALHSPTLPALHSL